MARDWRDRFIVDGASPRGRDPISEDAPAAQERRRGMFRRLRENLRETRQALTSEIQATLFEDLSEVRVVDG
jgi:fused signal recognition particle receptor